MANIQIVKLTTGEDLIGEKLEAGGSEINEEEASVESINEQVKSEGGDLQEKSFKMFDDMAEEDLDEDSTDEVDHLKNPDDNDEEEEEEEEE